MKSKTQKAITALDSMRLPELQARYFDVIGTVTRCPNRTYLIRKLSEALTLNEKASSSGSSRSHKSRSVQAGGEDNTGETHVSVVELIDNVEVADAGTHPVDDTDVLPIGVAAETQIGGENPSIAVTATEQTSGAIEEHARARRPSMTVDELRARYLEVVGRPSSSSHVAYLKWKIREAEKGRVRVGPAEQRRAAGTAVDVKVLPLRIERPTLTRIDSAWRTQGLRSRMEFFRRAIGQYLEALAGTH